MAILMVNNIAIEMHHFSSLFRILFAVIFQNVFVLVDTKLLSSISIALATIFVYLIDICMYECK